MSAHDGGPAFPSRAWGPDEKGFDGLSLRDYFAAKAMQSLAAEAVRAGYRILDGNTPGLGDELLGERSYAIADAMLKARNAS